MRLRSSSPDLRSMDCFLCRSPSDSRRSYGDLRVDGAGFTSPSFCVRRSSIRIYRFRRRSSNQIGGDYKYPAAFQQLIQFDLVVAEAYIGTKGSVEGPSAGPIFVIRPLPWQRGDSMGFIFAQGLPSGVWCASSVLSCCFVSYFRSPPTANSRTWILDNCGRIDISSPKGGLIPADYFSASLNGQNEASHHNYKLN
ncbi:hypothetical protein TB1_026487 [Malus domestica]